jgi:hypothetical protein
MWHVPELRDTRTHTHAPTHAHAQASCTGQVLCGPFQSGLSTPAPNIDATLKQVVDVEVALQHGWCDVVAQHDKVPSHVGFQDRFRFERAAQGSEALSESRSC